MPLHPDAPSETPAGRRPGEILQDADIIEALRGVIDPEIGLNIVDLGLIEHAGWRSGGIHVIMMMTAPTCPMAEVLTDQARSVLRRSFAAAPIIIQVRRDASWSPARISASGRAQLGWTAPKHVIARRAFAWSAVLSGGRSTH